jgi:hypothetical protein
MNLKHEALWPLKNYKLYIVYALILYNSFHLIIGSRLILTQSELLVLKCCHANFKVFSCIYDSQRIQSNFNLLHIIILVIHYLFW